MLVVQSVCHLFVLVHGCQILIVFVVILRAGTQIGRVLVSVNGVIIAHAAIRVLKALSQVVFK